MSDVGPKIDSNEFGQYFLSVPQACVYYHLLPPIDALEYRDFLRCNPFIMYRRCLQKASGLSTHECSKIAKISWSSANDQLKEFFRNYANDVLNNRKKVYRIVNNRSKPKKSSFRRFVVDQEVHTRQHLEAQTEFQICSMRPTIMRFSIFDF
ncbi:unnamed protein product [Rhizophagus irregularis]|uniref:MATA-HMG n=1 Tax=Rhizophagus irregularis TaxID=588596 RepID=A0A1B1EV27_9GLOM|nr:MATA-HMG [Rhizophagus irregularis]PKK66390.1 hypothetical protein RhiirC2_784844 [Rhizophagus irregularis]CAB4389824.1 unnamed protein product [Rhizophagus irregularis]CAB5367109.1 unnamed protein product [Rhizophagus irregularis]